jgi:hypothetical protein
MNGLLAKKMSGPDYDIADFDENDFDVYGWGFKGILRVSRLKGLMRVKNE